MKTIPVEQHKTTHSYCGDVYHNFGPPQDYKQLESILDYEYR